MIDQNIVEVCRAYAELICAARRLRHDYYSHCLIAAARALVGSAPVDAMPHLDTVKRVLEIDTTVTTPSVALMRASIEMPRPLPPVVEKEWPLSITCPKCNKTSWNLNDIRNGWCDNCKAYTGGVP